MFVPTNSLMLMRKFEAAKPLSCSSASGIWFTLGLAHLFVAVARNDFGLLLIELGVAKFARVAYRNILDEVCRSKLCRCSPLELSRSAVVQHQLRFGMSWRPL
jgi:hypothetical protein